MKLLALAFTILALPLASFASKEPLVSHVCGAPRGDSKLNAGPSSGVINRVLGLEIPATNDPAKFVVKMTADGVRTVDAMNGDMRPKTVVESYEFKEIKSGMLLELSNNSSNTFEFDAIFLEFGSPKVQTAGPIPPGTFKEQISMAFVDSNQDYRASSPMIVRKLVFDCKVTYQY